MGQRFIHYIRGIRPQIVQPLIDASKRMERVPANVRQARLG